jgi:hypothetical protein
MMAVIILSRRLPKCSSDVSRWFLELQSLGFLIPYPNCHLGSPNVFFDSGRKLTNEQFLVGQSILASVEGEKTDVRKTKAENIILAETGNLKKENNNLCIEIVTAMG